MNKFTSNEMEILKLLAGFRNYDNLETEIDDNAVGVYIRDITEYTTLTSKIARGVISSLEQKDMVVTDSVNGEVFFRATDECLKYLYNTLDKMDEEQKFYDKLTDWLAVDNLDNDNITVSNVYSFNEDGYYQRIFIVTEKHHCIPYDNKIDVYVIRMFGFNDNVNLSVDYEETMTYTELLKNMGDIFKIIIDKIEY